MDEGAFLLGIIISNRPRRIEQLTPHHDVMTRITRGVYDSATWHIVVPSSGLSSR
jgi:hypothetical protein